MQIDCSLVVGSSCSFWGIKGSKAVANGDARRRERESPAAKPKKSAGSVTFSENVQDSGDARKNKSDDVSREIQAAFDNAVMTCRAEGAALGISRKENLELYGKLLRDVEWRIQLRILVC